MPGATFFEAAIYVFAIHGVVYPMNRRIFQRDGVRRTHYSSIPSFHHSNCERSELSSDLFVMWRLIFGILLTDSFFYDNRFRMDILAAQNG